MKKILAIICIFSFVSIPSFSFANSQNIEDLLNIKYGPEVFELEAISFPDYSFSHSAIQNTYNTYKANMEILKGALIEKYSRGEFDYYQMRGIVTNFSYFMYYTNQMFKHIKQKELGYDGKELNVMIHSDYEKTRTFYNLLKNSVYQR